MLPALLCTVKPDGMDGDRQTPTAASPSAWYLPYHSRLNRGHDVKKILVVARLTGAGAEAGARIPKIGAWI
jgi:hypothetical protein